MSKGLADELRQHRENDSIRTNTFDLSHTSRVTARLGRIMPVLIRKVNPNERYKINTSYGFDLRSPLVSTLPPHITAHVRYFYVRMRTLWDNFNQFIMQDPTLGTTSITHPILDKKSGPLFGPGSISDSLGVPSMKVASVNSTTHVQPFADIEKVGNFALTGEQTHGLNYFMAKQSNFFYRPRISFPTQAVHTPDEILCHVNTSISFNHLTSSFSESLLMDYLKKDYPYLLSLNQTPRGTYNNSTTLDPYSNFGVYPFYGGMTHNIVSNMPHGHARLAINFMRSKIFADSKATFYGGCQDHVFYLAFYQGATFNDAVPVYTIKVRGVSYAQAQSFDSADDAIVYDSSASFNTSHTAQWSNTDSYVLSTQYFVLGANILKHLQALQGIGTLFPVIFDPRISNISTSNMSLDNLTFGYVGYATGSTTSLTSLNSNYSGGYCNYLNYPSVDGITYYSTLETSVSALPYRALEAIYNSHFRHPIINPFKINGAVAVDKYCTHRGDGITEGEAQFYVDQSPDGSGYQYCNYEDDLLTTMIPSPQMTDSKRPLVGITIQDKNHATLVYQQGTLDVMVDENQKLTGISTSSLPADDKTVLTIEDAIHYGIDFRDFANVKAMTNWLEKTYRNGRFSYDEFIETHFGKYPSYRPNFKPVFLGGMDTEMDSSKVVNSTAGTSESPLGVMASIGSFNQDKGKPIICDCDEYGFIVGVMFFTVSPIYTQLMPSFMYDSLPKDYMTPEFANLGLQPIYAKVMPHQCDWSVTDPDDPRCPEHIIGYNRQFVEHTAAWDSAHGDYLLPELQTDFCMRYFDDVPESGQQLLTMDPKDISNMFSLPLNADPIKGAIHFDIEAQLWLNQTPNVSII